MCPMATALDFVGDRWTILIIRELLGGPARFQELKSGLPGVATNLLTERLRRMESDGIVRRVESGGSSLYALTQAGAGIRTAIEELGIWAARMGRVGPAPHERSARSIAMALQAILVRSTDRLPADSKVLELDMGGEYLEIVIGRRPTVTVRTSVQPDARATTDAAAMAKLLAGEIRAVEAIGHVAGDPDATASLITTL